MSLLTGRIETIDGTATVNEDYVGIDEILTFQPGEVEKQVSDAREMGEGGRAQSESDYRNCVIVNKIGSFHVHLNLAIRLLFFFTLLLFGLG